MNPLRDLQLRLRELWHLPTLLAVSPIVFLVALFSFDPLDIAQGKGQPVDASITQITSTDRSRYQGRWPGLRVSAETAEGVRGITTALPTDLTGCKVGDRIEAQQSGLKLYLNPRPCE
jgi:hypothetical protein